MPSTATIDGDADRDADRRQGARAGGACAGRTSRCAGRRRSSVMPLIGHHDAPSRTSTRRGIAAAMSRSCVITTIVAPSALSSRSSATISPPERVSRLPVGSSANTIDGRPTSARAIATRWRSPPESFAGWCVSRWPRPTRSSDRARPLAPLAGRRAGVQQPGGDVLERRHPVEQEELLEHEADVLARAGSPSARSRMPATSCPATATPPARGPLERAHDVQQRRLARARRADDREQLAGRRRAATTPRSASTPPGYALRDVLEREHAHCAVTTVMPSRRPSPLTST